MDTYSSINRLVYDQYGYMENTTESPVQMHMFVNYLDNKAVIVGDR